jgi:hypothetical protein
MVHEVTRTLGLKKGDPISLLIVASLFREEMPWMYELGIEAYRMDKDGTPEDALAARRRFLKAGDLMRRGPFGFDEFGFDPKLLHMVMRDLDHFLEPDSESESDQTAAEGPRSRVQRTKTDKPE